MLEAEAETGVDTMRRSSAYWLAKLDFFIYNPGPPARGETAHGILSFPTSITTQENAPTDIPTGQSSSGNFSTEGPSSQVTEV